MEIYNIHTNTVNWDEAIKIPEIAILETIPQHSWWHAEGNALNHTKMVVNRMLYYIDNNAGVFNDPDYRKILVYAALFHDVGKAVTTSIGEDGYYHCPNHAEKGAEIMKDVLPKLNISSDLITAICSLIRNHMCPRYAMKEEDQEKAILKLANSLENIDFEALILLKRCDDEGSIHPKSDIPELLDKALEIFYDKISYKRGTMVTIKKLETIDENHKKFGHPNGIDNGYEACGKLFIPITIGWGVFLGKTFNTSYVTKIIDKNHFQTKNSVYFITENYE